MRMPSYSCLLIETNMGLYPQYHFSFIELISVEYTVVFTECDVRKKDAYIYVTMLQFVRS